MDSGAEVVRLSDVTWSLPRLLSASSSANGQSTQYTDHDHSMTTRELSTQLTALSESVRDTFQLIGRLSKLSFQPGSTPLESGDRNNDVRIELTQDIHEGLKQHEDTLELLKTELNDLVPSSTRYSRRDTERDTERARLSAQAAALATFLMTANSTTWFPANHRY